MSVAVLGCSTAPVKINHYLLNTPKGGVVQKELDLPLVLIKQVNIADYLRQANLVILLTQHEVYYSPQDVWAESLQSSFTQALLEELNNARTHHYIGVNSPLAALASSTISIDLAHFHSTHLSTVVQSGRYWITTTSNKLIEKSDTAITEQKFYFELDLQQDGFAHAVDKLRETVTLLAQQINREIVAMPHN